MKRLAAVATIVLSMFLLNGCIAGPFVAVFTTHGYAGSQTGALPNPSLPSGTYYLYIEPVTCLNPGPTMVVIVHYADSQGHTNLTTPQTVLCTGTGSTVKKFQVTSWLASNPYKDFNVEVTRITGAPVDTDMWNKMKVTIQDVSGKEVYAFQYGPQ